MKTPRWLALFFLALCTFHRAALAETAASLPEFLYDTPGTYGWEPVKGDLSYDFFKDGRLHAQGKEGEASMWEGTWKLKGDQLTLKIPALKVNRTYAVKIDGAALVLDQQRYRRYKP